MSVSASWNTGLSTQSWTPSVINLVDCRPHLSFRTSPPAGAVNNRPTVVAVYIAFSDGQGAMAKLYKSRVCNKVPSGRILIFGNPLISLKYSAALVEGKSVRKKISSFHAAVSIQYRRVTDRHTTTANTALAYSVARLKTKTSLIAGFLAEL